MNIFFTKISGKGRIFPQTFLLVILWVFFIPNTVSADCWTSDLSEEDQLAMARQTFADGVYSASSETAKCYLDEFSNGKAREEMFFLRAEALRKGGDLKASIKAYNELKKNYPKSKSYLDNAMLKQGISLAQNRNFPLAISTLQLLLNDYPKSKFRDEAHYWLGYSKSFNAELLQKKSRKKAVREYQASIKHFKTGDPKSLTQKQRQERWYLIGHSWWFLDDFSKAAEAWTNYLKDTNYNNQEQALKLKYRLASKFQQVKKFAVSETWFERIVTEHPNSKLAPISSFWRAEMAYAASIQKAKIITPKSSRRIVKLYKAYLRQKNKEHQALTYFRIGILEQNNEPLESISAFKNYLNTEDKMFKNEVQYRLAFLYIDSKQPKKAIKIFNEYLKTKDKIYLDEVQYRLGYLYVENKQLKKAIKTFNIYLNRDEAKHDEEIQIRLGYLYIETKQLKKAIQIFEKYINRKDAQHLAEVQIRLGYLYIETKQLKKAIKIFKTYLASGDKEHKAEIQIRLGYLYIENKQIKNAIQIFEKYLSSDHKEHSIEIKLRVAYLYVETKQNFLAISMLEKVRAHPDYQNNIELLQTLTVLYKETVSKEKYVQFLASVSSDQKLKEQVRQKFKSQLILTYYDQKNCKKLLVELNNKPGYLEKTKQLNPKEWQHLMFLKGSCLLETKKWKEARIVFRQTRESKKYRQQSIEMLLEAHRQLEDWKAITWEFEEIFDSESPPMTIQYFQLWMFAAQRRTDFQRLDRIKIISERWANNFPEDKQNLSNINQYLSRTQIRELSNQGKWKEISTYIRNEVASNNLTLDEEFFSQLLFAEQKMGNWQGILSAYTLLSTYDKIRAEKIDALVDRAKAAKNLGKDNLSVEYYKKALEIQPENEKEKKQQEEIRGFLAMDAFQKLVKKGEWDKVSKIIRQEVKAKKRILDDKNFNLLLYAENQKSGDKKYNGILNAYALLKIHDKKKAITVEGFIDQAKAAENLGKKKLSQKFYSQVSKLIHQEVKAKKRSLDDKNFELLLYTENKKTPRQKYNGILDAYALLAKIDKKKTLTIDALIDQGYAAEKLGGYKRAKGYYKRALNKVNDKNVELVMQLVGELTKLYERSKDYKSLVQIYKRAYKVLKKNSNTKREYQTYAYLIGYHQLTHLKQNNNARIWMMRADGGGTSNQELEAGYWVAKLDINAGKNTKALKRLKELAGRKIPKNSAIYAQINFELGTLYHSKENWKSALMHYRFVSNANVPNQLKALKSDAKQNANDIDNYLKSVDSLD